MGHEGRDAGTERDNEEIGWCGFPTLVAPGWYDVVSDAPTPDLGFEQQGYAIRTLQELLGHADVSTTMIYTHVLNRRGKGVQSPIDALL